MTQLLENTLTGGVLILVTALLRRVLKNRVPPEGWLALWAVCLVRLLTPFSPESPLSLYGLTRLMAAPKQTVPVISYIPSAAALNSLPEQAAETPALTLPDILHGAMLAVGAFLLLRFVIAWLRTRRAVSCTILLGKDDPRYGPLPGFACLREGPMEGAPLTFGVVRPTVVLTPGLSGDTLDWVLAHEGVHARRRDNLWHYVMTAALIVHWYNPAVWLMARLLRRDLELSCDRAVLARLGRERRAEYAQVLISLSTQAEGPAFCRQFGPKQAEERIIAIMKYKKTTAAGIVLALALTCGVTAAFASTPVDKEASLSNASAKLYSASSSSVLANGIDRNALTSQEEIDKALAELEQKLSQAVADGWMTRDEADDMLAKAKEAIENGEAPLWISLQNSQEALPDAEIGAASIFYEDENGNLVPIDDSAVTIGFNGDNLLGSAVYGYEVVEPEEVSLDMMKELLARQVADGEMTQEEADKTLAEVQAMLDEAAENGGQFFMFRTGDDGLPSYTATMYSDTDGAAAPAADTPASDGGQAVPASFLSSMGCTDVNCTDPAHYHDCDASCLDTSHYHTCAADCGIAGHLHNGAGCAGSHHSSGHHSHHV